MALIKEETRPTLDQLKVGYVCQNGLTVKFNLVSTEQNPLAGLLEIISPVNVRRIMTARFENGLKVAHILCEDFDMVSENELTKSLAQDIDL